MKLESLIKFLVEARGCPQASVAGAAVVLNSNEDHGLSQQLALRHFPIRQVPNCVSPTLPVVCDSLSNSSVRILLLPLLAFSSAAASFCPGSIRVPY